MTTRSSEDALKFASSNDVDGTPGALSVIPLDVPRTSVVSSGAEDVELTNAKPFAGIAVLGVIVIPSTLKGRTVTVCGCTEHD